MADRYDPKVTVRPAADRKGSDSRQGPATSDDPLFELARIVSGRGAGAAPAGFSPPPARGRPAPPPPEPPKPAAPEIDILGDLEAELLSDLQASFAAVKEATEAAQPEPPPAQPAPSPQPPFAAAPPPAGSARPPQPEPAPQQPTSPPIHAAPPPYAAPPHEAPQARAAPPPQPPAVPPAQQSPPRMSAAARPPIQQVPPRQPAAPAAPPPRERPHAPPPASPAPPSAKKVDVGQMNLRPTAAPQVRVTAAPPTPPERPAPAAAKPSRWDKPAEPPKPQAAAASRFAPPRAAGHRAVPPPPQQPAPPPPAEDEEPPFDDGLPFAHESEESVDEFPLDAFDIVPGYGDEAELPPYPEDELEPLRRRGVPRSLVAIASILALVLVGVLAFVMFRPGSSGNGAPPIISADAGPTKIAPPEPPSTGNGSEQNKLIYDRVDSGSSGAPADTKLVTPGSEPIAPVPSTDANNPIARIITPGQPGTETPGTADTGNGGTGDTAAAANGGDSAQSIGPRKVRTVVVRPDGTIVSSDAAPAPGDAPASTDAVPMPAPTPEVPTVSPPATNDDTAAIAGGTGGHELTITTNPPATTTTTPAAPPAPTVTHTPNPTPAPKPTAPKVVATGGDGGPIDLTPGASGGSQVASATPGGQGALPLVAGGMMVQVSSQRTEDAARATFRDLQTRYPSILGGYNANIQRADLGSRGIYFRVRVGPFASADAQSLCSALKNAGGDCILAR